MSNQETICFSAPRSQAFPSLRCFRTIWSELIFPPSPDLPYNRTASCKSGGNDLNLESRPISSFSARPSSLDNENLCLRRKPTSGHVRWTQQSVSVHGQQTGHQLERELARSIAKNSFLTRVRSRKTRERPMDQSLGLASSRWQTNELSFNYQTPNVSHAA